MKSKYLLISLVCLTSSLYAGYMDTDGYYVLEDQELAAWNGASASNVNFSVVLNKWSATNVANVDNQWWIQLNPVPANEGLLPDMIYGPGIKGLKMTVTNTGTSGFNLQVGVGNPYNNWWQLGTNVTVNPGETKTSTIDITDTSGVPDRKDVTNMWLIFQVGSKQDFMFDVQTAHKYAYDPMPFYKSEPDPTFLTDLCWKNVETAVLNHVYFGNTMPNPADPNQNWRNTLALAAVIENPTQQQCLPVASLPAEFLPLADGTTYYWIVDAHDKAEIETEPNFPGQVWEFTAVVNKAPEFDLGDTQYLWLGQGGDPGQVTVTLDPQATDDDIPVPQSELTYKWEKSAGLRIGDMVFPFTTKSLGLTFTQRGVYDIKLSVSDTKLTTIDTVRFVVGNDPCDTYRLSDGAAWFKGADLDQDCLVGMNDLSMLIANWMDCSDFLSNCQ